MTIEKLEALERAATAGPMRIHVGYVPKADYPHLATLGEKNDTVLAKFASVDEANTTAAYRNALGPLLAVAKAAKGLRATDSKGDWCPMTEQAMEDRERFTAELDAAIAQLEATP